LEPDAGRLHTEPVHDHDLRERVRSLLRWEVGLSIALTAVIVFGITASSQFLTSFNIFYLNLSIGEVAIMTLPMTLLIVTGEIDLSVASILGMSSALVGDLYSHGWSMPLVIVTVLAVGAVAGWFNGFLVTRVGLPSLAVTIGTLTLYRGIAVAILGPSTISSFPTTYTDIGVTPLPHTGGYLSYSVGIFIVLAFVFAIVLHATPAGRSLFVMGANEEAARYAGIRVKRTKLILFVLSGIVCALAGVLYTFRLSTAVQDNGIGLELSVVTVVLLGGVSIFGGRGTIVGVVLAIAVFAGLQNALFLTNFEQRAMGIVTGSLLLLSVLLPNVSAFLGRGRDFLRRRELGAARGARAREAAS
jgi:rhamnose transport system permease protein